MVQLDNYQNGRKRRIYDEVWFAVRWGFWVPLITVPATYISGLGWVAVIYISLAATIVAAAFLSVFTFLRFRPLAKWDDLSNITDLTGFEKINKQSAYMPDKILEQQNISSLLVMGNGCSKWTRQPKKDAEIIDAFIRIRRGNGTIRFMASCPIHLSERDHEPNINKARKNAASLLKLREFKDRSKAAGGKFEIRTYKHVATLRLIILNETECIVGHYQEDGNGDSFDTPLLIFHHNHENKWGFGSAFKRMFESEWHRALEPTEDEWRKMMQLLKDIPE